MDEIKKTLFQKVEPDIWISVVKSLIGNDQNPSGTEMQKSGNIQTLKE